jgi:hypothetical protein
LFLFYLLIGCVLLYIGMHALRRVARAPPARLIKQS